VKTVVRTICGIAALCVLYGIYYVNAHFPVLTGFAAEYACSELFLSGRSDLAAIKQDIDEMLPPFGGVPSIDVNTSRRLVTATVAGGLFKKHAVYRERLGCTLANGVTVDELMRQAEEYRFDAPADHPPPLERSHSVMPDLERALDDAFREDTATSEKNTRAVLVIRDDVIVAERYAPGFDEETRFVGWSMTKSVKNALTGVLALDSKIDVYEQGILPEWRNDARRSITVDNLLRMNSGLRFDEVYKISSDVMHMLFDEPSTALYAASKPLESEPGSVWKYSTASPIILSRVQRLRVGGSPSEFYRYARAKLFDPVGIESVIIEPDASGDLTGMYATARDWARFGMLYLNDGVWEGQRILPEGWVRYSTTVTPGSPRGMYGALFWLNAGEDGEGANRRFPSLPADLYMAEGYTSQIIVIIPSHRLVIVRLGRTTDGSWNTEEFVAQIISAVDKTVA